MTTPRLAVALVLLALTLGACSSSDEVSQDLEGTEYWSTGVTENGEPVRLVAGTTITLRFTNGAVQARAGCNSISGTVDIQEGELQTGGLSMTGMGCDPERHAQDTFLINVLTGTPTVTIDGDTLRLETATASIDFIDAAIANPDLPLEGTTWEIDGFLSGGTASAFATDVRGTVRFEANTMQLFDGCANVDLPVEIEGTEIRFEPVGMPPVDECEAPPGYRQSIFTALSRGALEYSIDGASLTMATPDNVGFTLKASD
jgi:heat shock protein HslJ